MDEQQLMKKCSEIYDELVKLEMCKTDIGLEETVKKMFSYLGGKVYILEKSPRYLRYDGHVDQYTIGGSISIDYLDGDYRRLTEDLTKAYYTNNGGKIPNTTVFIRKLLEKDV